MNYAKVRNVKDPIRGTKLSAGIDFFVPEFDKKLREDLLSKNQQQITSDGVILEDKSIILRPGGRVLIPSGIHVDLTEVQQIAHSPSGPFQLPYGIMLSAHNKSGVGTKKGLDRLAEVVDEDYQGELHISVVNTSTETVEIAENDKLIQFILIPILLSTPVLKPLTELYKSESERGSGGFGSTGN